MYMRQPDVCFQQVVKLCQALSQRGHRPVVLVQSQASKGEDDRAIAARMGWPMIRPGRRGGLARPRPYARGAFLVC